MTPPRTAGRARDEDGSTLPLTVFYAALALAVILVVVAATSLYLERKRLFTLADGAALAGAESFDLTALHRAEDGIHARLQNDEVRQAVDDYLAAASTVRFDDLTVDGAGTPDGESAEVSISSYWRPPVVTLLLPEGIRMEVTSTARSVFG